MLWSPLRVFFLNFLKFISLLFDLRNISGLSPVFICYDVIYFIFNTAFLFLFWYIFCGLFSLLGISDTNTEYIFTFFPFFLSVAFLFFVCVLLSIHDVLNSSIFNIPNSLHCSFESYHWCAYYSFYLSSFIAISIYH